MTTHIIAPFDDEIGRTPTIEEMIARARKERENAVNNTPPATLKRAKTSETPKISISQIVRGASLGNQLTQGEWTEHCNANGLVLASIADIYAFAKTASDEEIESIGCDIERFTFITSDHYLWTPGIEGLDVFIRGGVFTKYHNSTYRKPEQYGREHDYVWPNRERLLKTVLNSDSGEFYYWLLRTKDTAREIVDVFERLGQGKKLLCQYDTVQDRESRSCVVTLLDDKLYLCNYAPITTSGIALEVRQ